MHKQHSLISAAVSGTDLDERLQSCSTVAEAWSVLRDWVLPCTLAQKRLLKEEFNKVSFPPATHPTVFFSRFDRLANMLNAVEVEVTEGGKVEAMITQLSDEFSVQKVILREKSHVTRKDVEDTVGSAYADRRVEEMRQQSVTQSSALPLDPHAFALGGNGGGGLGYSGGGRGSFGMGGFSRGPGGAGRGRWHGMMELGKRWQQRPMSSMLPRQQQPRQYPQQQPPTQRLSPMQPKPRHFPPPNQVYCWQGPWGWICVACSL